MRKLTLTIAALMLCVFANAGIVDRQLDPEFSAVVNDVLYKVYNLTTATIAKDKLVYVCGWMETGQPGQSPKICLADANVAGARAKYITTQAIGNATFCMSCLKKQQTLINQNTLGLSVGDAMYLSETAGAFTSTAPTNANSIQQIVGRVRAVSATVGTVEIDMEANNELVKIGSNEMQAGSIGPESIGLSVRAATNLAAGDLVYLSSYNATDGIFVANIADADVAGGQAQYVATGTILSGATGTVYKKASVAMNVGGAAAGDPIYLTVTGTTTNTKSTSAPTGSDDLVQIVGRVQVTGAAGPVLIDLLDFTPGIATNQIQDNAVSNDKLADFTGQGYIKVGGASGAPTDYDANNDGYILIGDGTDLVSTDFNNSGYVGVGDGTNYASVDITGDIDIATTGAATIQAGAVEPTMDGLTCRNQSGGNYAAGDFVAVTSANATNFLCTLADADAGGAQATHVVTAACNTGSDCVVARSAVISGDTDAAAAVGDPIYLTITGTTGNTWSLTAPTTYNSLSQVVGRVTVDAVAGSFLADLRSIPVTQFGTNEIRTVGISPVQEGLTCVNGSGGDYAFGDFVYVSSANATLPLCALADADVASGSAQYVVTAACVNGATCRVAKSVLVTGVDTSAAGSVGDALYLTTTGTTTNTWSVTAPTGTDDIVQIVGRVTVDGNPGQFWADLASLPVSKIATNEYQAGSVTGLVIGTGAVTRTNIADNTINYSKVSPFSTRFNFKNPAYVILDDLSAAPTGGATETVFVLYPEGSLQFYLEEQVGAPAVADVYAAARTTTANGMDFGLDNTDNDGMQLGPHLVAGGAGAFTAGTDTFYAKATFTVQDGSGVDPACLSLRTAGAYGDIDAIADLDNYGAGAASIVSFCIGSGAGVDPAVMHIRSRLAAAAAVDTTLAAHTWADGATHTLEIDVAASGAVTYKMDGTAVTGAAALTLPAGVFYPFIIHDSSGDVNDNFYISLFEYGMQ